MEGGLQKITW